MKNILYLLLLITLTSCTSESEPTITDCWLLFSVESMDLPDSNPTKINYYPQTPRESNSKNIGKDGDYSKWSWNDSLSIEYSINLDGEKYSEIDNFSYQVVNDTIIIESDSNTVVKRGFNIIEEQLILTGYTNSQLYGKRNYRHIFNLIEE